MKHQHPLPFSSQILADGRVRFRLWAPSAHRLEVCLEGDDHPIAMKAQGQGWFEVISNRARAGSLYRFRIDGSLAVPDPASRYNPQGVHGPSAVVDPTRFEWQDDNWRGRSWQEAVLYELHVGAFTSQGSFTAAMERLDYLVELGITAIELMPLAAFPGERGWGYDGVLPFAPAACYGHPDELKLLIQTAHQKGVMVFLDVVYNHFGPEGNYLHTYAKPFFNERHHTPWGAAINFDAEGNRTVRDFYLYNALYWLEEFRFDGLRLDAVHTIMDDSEAPFLLELAEAVKRGPGREREVHLVLENADNSARYLHHHYTAQWNDDCHHALHVLVTGETDGYYEDYAERPIWCLGRCLAEGFAYQGEPSPHHGNTPRGEPSRELPLTAFVNFLQNHDQIGNRAFGERLGELADPQALRAAVAILLLAPSPPLLFMGEEFNAAQPFLYFCDFGPELATAVSEGRRKGFARFAKFGGGSIPDPNEAASFERSKLDWGSLQEEPHRHWLAFYRDLLDLRRQQLVPRLHGLRVGQASFDVFEKTGLQVNWPLEGGQLSLLANLGATPIAAPPRPPGDVLYASASANVSSAALAPWSVVWLST
jgi:malto-oligosyltrehalose trehalohydrolase